MTIADNERRQRIGLWLAPALLVAVFVTPAPAELGVVGWRTLGVALLMATWWITEAVPIPATSLVPLVAFPLVGAGSMREAASPYADPVVYLFMGGFIIALAMERWDLHRRVALRIIGAVGTSPARLIAGFMLATALISMWVNNTATTLMMLPVGLSVLELAERTGATGRGSAFEAALLLGIAYASSIGGVGTLVGTAPNVLMAGFFEQTYGFEIGFAEWLLVGVPVVALGLPITYVILTRLVFPIGKGELPGARAEVERELAELGPMSREERSVGAVFLLTAAAWVFRPLIEPFAPQLTDAGIAVTGALALFVLPASDGRRLLDWDTARRLPWGTLVLFGGGLSLAGAFTRTGLSEWIGTSLPADALPLVLVMGIVTAAVIFLTELTSNTATTATFLPVVAAMAVGIGQNPLYLAVPAVIAASCAFMLPVATPPNAIVYGTDRVSVPQMARAGIWLNLAFIVLLVALAYGVFGWALGTEPGVLPEWATPASGQ